MAFPQNADSRTGREADQRQDPSPRRAVMVRCPTDLLERIDRAAKRLGLSRAAFFLSATAERLERME